jgi:DNA replication protein DnaC
MLKKLRLSGVLQSLELRTKQATDDNLALSEFLYRLLADEVERREAKQLMQRIRRANFEHAKTIEDFDFTFNPSIPKAKVLELATCAFVERHDNILIVGPLAQGLPQERPGWAPAQGARRPGPVSGAAARGGRPARRRQGRER